jgi:hypothetical protein
MIINIGNVYPSAPISPTTATRPAAIAPAFRLIDGDTLEVSSRGESLSRAVEESSLRIARNRAIRAEICSGTYETQERIDRTVDRILDVIA